MSSPFNRFYEAELSKLRSLSVEFSRENPSIAPMLGSESTDPDVERLLEGVAFLNALTRQKLDDEFPEIANELAAILAPQMLRPLPAATIIQFIPKISVNEAQIIPPGTEIASIPVEGTTCRFRTTSAVVVDGVTISGAKTAKTLQGNTRLSIDIERPATGKSFDKLRLFLGDEVPVASTWMMAMAMHLKSVRLVNDRGEGVPLKPEVHFPGFDEPLFPYPNNAFPGFRLLQELLFFPQKFLFVEFQDLTPASERVRGSKLQLQLEISKDAGLLPDLTDQSFMVGAAPAVNLFECDAEPVYVDHRVAEYTIHPEGRNAAFTQIFSVDSVESFSQGAQSATPYSPFNLLGSLGGHKKTYRLSRQRSIVDGVLETLITLPYNPNEIPTPEVLSIRLTCCNWRVTEALRLGDISRPTVSSPEMFQFKNIKPVTNGSDTLVGVHLLWGVIAHSATNLLALESVENLRALIAHYNASHEFEHSTRFTNDRYIAGMTGLVMTQESRLLRGIVVQGQKVTLEVDQTHWASRGLLYLWGSVLDRFLSGYSGINAYTRFEIHDPASGLELRWPLRQGLKRLL